MLCLSKKKIQLKEIEESKLTANEGKKDDEGRTTHS